MNGFDWTGFLGGLAGIVALLVQFYTLWQNRKASLTLFLPHQFTGNEGSSGQQFLFILIRISNSAERPAFLYLETIKAQIFSEYEWHRVLIKSVAPEAKSSFDLPEQHKQAVGINQFKLFNKFDEAEIRLDSPFTRYLSVTSDTPGVIKGATRLKLTVQDSNLKFIVLEAPLLMNNP